MTVEVDTFAGRWDRRRRSDLTLTGGGRRSETSLGGTEIVTGSLMAAMVLNRSYLGEFRGGGWGWRRSVREIDGIVGLSGVSGASGVALA